MDLATLSSEKDDSRSVSHAYERVTEYEEKAEKIKMCERHIAARKADEASNLSNLALAEYHRLTLYQSKQELLV